MDISEVGYSSGGTQMSRQFAFGAGRVKGVCCPARTVGLDPLSDKGLESVANVYDDLLSEEVGEPEGIIDEDAARLFWKEACEARKAHKYAYAMGQEVAEELGWSE